MKYFFRCSAFQALGNSLPVVSTKWYALLSWHCITLYGPSHFAPSFPSIGSLVTGLTLLKTQSPSWNFRGLTF